MIIATSITEEYLLKSKSFFESVNKHFNGRKICFCIGFVWKIEGWEVVYVPKDKLQCKWQPKNRLNYYSLQHGEFVNFYNFKDEDEVLFIDSDMILQRKFESVYNFKETDFYVTDSSFPATILYQAAINIGVKNYKEFFNQFEIDEEEEFCAAWLLTDIKNWKKLYNIVKLQYEEFLSYFEHHAAWQLFINYVIINYFRYKRLNDIIQNAEWYSGTEANNVNDVLVVRDQIVYFNHTKFNGNWKY